MTGGGHYDARLHGPAFAGVDTMRLSMLMLGLLGAPAALAAGPTVAESDFVALRDSYLARFKPLWLESQATWWEANITGADAAFDRKKAADKALVELHSQADVFAQLKRLRDGRQVADPLLLRELDVMYRAFLPGQADPQLQKKIVDLENDVEQAFNTYRGQVGQQMVTENDVREILAKTTDSAAAEAAWKAYMDVGRRVEARLRELVRLRNEMARQLGFPNFYAMRLSLDEVDEQELLRVFDELDRLTREPFAQLKSRIDAERAARFGITVADLRPWHYADLFFQEAPPDQAVNLDELYKSAKLPELCQTYYASLGLPADDILAHSDLYEKPGKCPHAFEADLNRAGDIRVLANVEPNLYWADTLLHELGHGVYDKFIGADVPWPLHEASHGITTEGVALMFGAMSKNEEWLTRVLHVDAAEAARVGAAARKALRTERLLFSRWAQVMVQFERGMYSDPDQDLGRLWWDLKKRYQLLNPPESVARPDYAAKVHVITNPVYYHNYMFGELFAAQVRHHIASQVLGLPPGPPSSFYQRPEVGAYLREQVFGPGNLYQWNELTRRATGAPLTPKCFVDDLAE
jgi:peptidyl-dipeptidase A